MLFPSTLLGFNGSSESVSPNSEKNEAAFIVLYVRYLVQQYRYGECIYHGLLRLNGFGDDFRRQPLIRAVVSPGRAPAKLVAWICSLHPPASIARRRGQNLREMLRPFIVFAPAVTRAQRFYFLFRAGAIRPHVARGRRLPCPRAVVGALFGVRSTKGIPSPPKTCYWQKTLLP